MDHFKLTIVMMAVTDTHWGPRDAHGRRRQFTAEELDALADSGWHVPALKGVIAARVNAMRSRWRPPASHSLSPTPLPSADPGRV